MRKVSIQAGRSRTSAQAIRTGGWVWDFEIGTVTGRMLRNICSFIFYKHGKTLICIGLVSGRALQWYVVERGIIEAM